MDEERNQPIPTNALTSFVYVRSTGLALVSARPKKITVATIGEILQPGEKLLSYGELPKAVYFGFNGSLLLFLFLLGLFGPAAFEHKGLIDVLGGAAQQLWLTLAVLVLVSCLTLWVIFRCIHRAGYVLTDRRVIHLGDFVRSFDFASFEQAKVHQDSSGTSYIEFWLKGAEGPSVVLELTGEPQIVTALLPAGLLRPNVSAALPPPPELPAS